MIRTLDMNQKAGRLAVLQSIQSPYDSRNAECGQLVQAVEALNQSNKEVSCSLREAAFLKVLPNHMGEHPNHNSQLYLVLTETKKVVNPPFSDLNYRIEGSRILSWLQEPCKDCRQGEGENVPRVKQEVLMDGGLKQEEWIEKFDLFESEQLTGSELVDGRRKVHESRCEEVGDKFHYIPELKGMALVEGTKVENNGAERA